MAGETTPQQIARLEADLARLGRVVGSVRGDASLNDPELAGRLGTMFELAKGIIARNCDGFAVSLADDLATLKGQLLDLIEDFDPASDEPMYAIQRAQGSLGVLMVPVDRALMSAQALGLRPAMPVGHVPENVGIPAATLDRRSVDALLGRLDRIGRQLDDLKVEAAPERAPSAQQRHLVTHFLAEMRSQLGLMRAELTLKRAVDFNAISRAVDTTVELTKDLVASARGMVRTVSDAVREKALAVRGETRRLVRGVRTFVARTVKRVVPEEAKAQEAAREEASTAAEAMHDGQPKTGATGPTGPNAAESEASTGKELAGLVIALAIATEDEGLAKEAESWLARAGATPRWLPEFRIGVRDRSAEPDLVVAVWTPQSVRSEIVLIEASRAAKRGLLLPFRLVEFPARDIPLEFRNFQTSLWTTREEVVAALEGRIRDGDRPSWLRTVAEVHHAQGIKFEDRQMLDEAADEFRSACRSWRELAAQFPYQQWEAGLATSLLKLGGVLAAQRDFSGALTNFRESLGIREMMYGRERKSVPLLHAIAGCYMRIGDVLYAQGKLNDALLSFQTQRAVAERLGEIAPDDTATRRHLAVAWNKIGDVFLAQGHAHEAVDAYRNDLSIAVGLAATKPEDRGLQRDLSVSYERLGDALTARKKHSSALDSYRLSLSIRERLAATEGDPIVGQSALVSTLDRIGGVLVALGRPNEALKSFQKCLAVNRGLVARAPDDTQLKRRMAGAYVKCGGTYEVLDRLEDALHAYHGNLAICDALAASNPTNVDLQEELADSLSRIGHLQLKAGDNFEAAATFERELAVCRTVLMLRPEDVPSTIKVVSSLWQLAELKGASGRAGLKEALGILQRLAAAGRLEEARLEWIPHIEAQLAGLQR